MARQPLLIVVTGPTGSGKTDLAIALARELGCRIISADSRQIYRDIPVTTAAPTAEQLAAVPHYMVGTLPLDARYSAADFADDVLRLLPSIWNDSGCAIMCGGSMMYIDAVTRGIDPLPTISDEVRRRVVDLRREVGDEGLLAMLEIADPAYYARVDRHNMRRVMHALEICMEAGHPVSELRTGRTYERPFRVVKLAIDYPREDLFARINARVLRMADKGMVDEARRVSHLRHLNSLNTVGFKEMFAYFDGRFTLDEALARLAKNTRVYAKKQLLWLRGDPAVHMLNPATALPDALRIVRLALSDING